MKVNQIIDVFWVVQSDAKRKQGLANVKPKR